MAVVASAIPEKVCGVVMEGRILLLAGDGIGPDVVAEAVKVLECVNACGRRRYQTSEDYVGGAAYDVYGVPLHDDTMAKAKAHDGVLLGAVGGETWESLPFSLRPERGLLALRKGLGLFANVRPAIVFEPLLHASSLKPDIVKGLDIVIIRELTGGLYFGEPRGIQRDKDGQRVGVNTLVYHEHEIRRLARVGFEMARLRQKKVCSIDKANVLEATGLWREVVSALQEQEYPDIALTHMYVDNAAMQLVRCPSQFDVLITTNMFGDILSDEASMLTGSLGMLPSASVGDVSSDGRRHGLYEPVHGSAPDIAGQGIANPLATILSLALMLRSSFLDNDAAHAIEDAVVRVLRAGYRTRDIAPTGGDDAQGVTVVSTQAMGSHVAHSVREHWHA